MCKWIKLVDYNMVDYNIIDYNMLIYDYDLIDHYFYLIAHMDYGTPIKAKYHCDVPHFTFTADGVEHTTYIFEGKITHYMELPKLPWEENKNETR